MLEVPSSRDVSHMSQFSETKVPKESSKGAIKIAPPPSVQFIEWVNKNMSVQELRSPSKLFRSLKIKVKEKPEFDLKSLILY